MTFSNELFEKNPGDDYFGIGFVVYLWQTHLTRKMHKMEDSWRRDLQIVTPIQQRILIDWCCIYYFVRNSLVALLEALSAQIFVFRIANIGVFWFFFLCARSLTKPFSRSSQPGSCAWLSPFLLFFCLFVGKNPANYTSPPVGREVNPLGVVTHGQRHKPRRAYQRQRHKPRTCQFSLHTLQVGQMSSGIW